MKNYRSILLLLLLSIIVITGNSCSLVEGIFKAGVWTGILIVALVVGLIIYVISRATKK